MKKKDQAIMASVIFVIVIAVGISVYVFLPKPSYTLESEKLIGTWYRSGEDFFEFPNWTFDFYSNGSGKDIQEGGLLFEPNINTFLWEIKNGEICLEYTNMNNSVCMQARFVNDYNHLELKVTELMEFKFELKYVFVRIS